MKRSACALGVVLGVGVWVSAGAIGAEEPAVVEPAAEAAAPEDEAPTASVRGIALLGELLFIKPTIDDIFFAIRSATASPPSPTIVGPSGRRVADEFGYEPASRIGAAYQFPESGRSLELAYTRLDANASESVSGSFLWATRGAPELTFTFGPNTGGYRG